MKHEELDDRPLMAGTLPPSEALGRVQSRYVWEGSRHHVQNHLLFLLCIATGATIFGLAHQSGQSLSDSPLMQVGLTLCLTIGIFFLFRAVHDQMMRHIRYQAIVGDRGFSIMKYNEESNLMLEEIVQPYDTLLRIEKHEHNDVSEEGVYLRTVSNYSFYGTENTFSQEVKFNRNDIRLQERDGMPDVKALFAIERAYNESCQHATIAQVEEPETVIPSRPQPVIRLKAPVMWRDIDE